MAFLKILLGGVLATTIMWFVVVGERFWSTISFGRNTGLIAGAGGWDYLVQVPRGS